MRRITRCLAVGLVGGACASAALAPPAEALSLRAACTVGGAVDKRVKLLCTALSAGSAALKLARSLLGGNLFGGLKGLAGLASGAGSAIASRAATAASVAVGLAAVGAWVLGGARFAVHAVAAVLSQATTPQLQSTWFSSTYWRVAGIAAVLTLPFLFAAAVQALVRSDLSLLLRAALGYLPLAMVAVSVAAPLTMLLLAASDQLAGAVSAASGDAGHHFLSWASILLAGITLGARSPFLAFFLGLLTVAGAVALWVELVIREAAVYVVVLMLPLAFAALVWPARRVWAVRVVELLVALILSKFAIVAVLSLAAAALDSTGFSLTGVVAGVVLLAMAVSAPWALLRLVPMAELASSAAGALHHELRGHAGPARSSLALGEEGDRWASKTADMRRESEQGLEPGSDLGESVGDPAGLRPLTAEGAPAAAAANGAAAPDGSPPGEPAPPDQTALRPPPLELLRHPDLSHDVLVGPEAGRGEPPIPREPADGSGEAPRSPQSDDGAPGADDGDPTPPTPPPPDGLL
jgi:hypothetical protein